MDDLFFELNYGDSGLNISYAEILNTPYDTLSHWHKRYTKQKEFETAQAKKLKR